MAIQSRKNQYLGVNAHQLSLMQTPRSDGYSSWWLSFHFQYVVSIMEELIAKLPASYVAITRPSLQIYSDNHEVEIPEKQPDCVMIYERKHDYQDSWENPVIQVEVLFSYREQGLPDYGHYCEKRMQLLSTGISLAEVDFLHEVLSPNQHFPIYPTNAQSQAYSITVFDPRPNWHKGNVILHAFGVDDPIPTIHIPLLENESLSLDLGKIYNRTYSSLRFDSFGVDYEQLPARFETYSEADQERIKVRMEIVKHAHDKGLDLEQGPFPLTETL